MRAVKAVLFLVAAASAVSIFAEVPGELLNAVPLVKAADQRAQTVDKAVWQDFNFQTVPLFVFDAASREGLLFHVSPLPSGFAPMDAAHPEVGMGTVGADQKPIAGVGPIAERLGAWIPVTNLTQGDQSKSIELLYRRAFRVFEAYRGFPQPTKPEGVYFPELDAQNNALSRAEDMLLIHMLSAPKSDLPSLFAAFVSLRHRRQATLPAGLPAYESSMEVTNGIAEYAGFKAVEGSASGDARQSLVDALNSFGKNGKGVAGERFAYTGCALALILDRTGMDWKNDLEKTDKASFEPILLKAAGNAPLANLTFLNLDDLLKQETESAAAVNAGRQAKVDAITKAPGLVVDLNLASALAIPGIQWSNKYVPGGVTDIDRNSQVRDSYYNLTGKGLLEFASSRPIYIKVRKSIVAGFAKDEMPYVTLDGKKVDLKAGQVVTGEVDVTGVHYSLHVNQAELSYAPGVLTVTPVAPGQKPSGGEGGGTP